jgi:hypothetical protein
MASLAGMLQARGHRITGSDAAAYPPMSDVLAGLGIPLLQPYAEANLTPRPGFSQPDLVIVGNAISRGNIELEYVLDTRIPFTSMAAVLHDEFLPGRESLVVAGTHGKTTTTSMLAWIYEVASKGDREQGTVTPASKDRSPGTPTVTPASKDRSPGTPTVTPASKDRSPGTPTGNGEQGTASQPQLWRRRPRGWR